VQTACDDLVVTLDRALAYLKTSNEAEGLTRILLSGGSAQMQGLKELMSEKFRVPIELANPLLRIGYEPSLFEGRDPSREAPALTVAIGLALRRVGSE